MWTLLIRCHDTIPGDETDSFLKIVCNLNIDIDKSIKSNLYIE